MNRQLLNPFGKQTRVSGDAARAGSIGAADQLVISGVNFLLMIAAARALGPSSFGVFAVVYLVLTSTQPIQESLVTAPFNVFVVSKTQAEYRRYLTSVAVYQILLALVLGTAIAAVAVILHMFAPSTGRMVLSMAAAASAWQFQEFIRRVLYVESRFAAALLNDTITHGVRLILLIALFTSNNLTASHLFLLLAATWTMGSLLGVWQIRRRLDRSVTLRSTGDVAAAHWTFGRWLIVTAGISYIPWYVTTAVMTASLSTAAYGAFRAFEQLVNAANVPLQTVYNLLRPRLARDAHFGHNAMLLTMKPLLIVGGAAFLIFGVGLLASQEYLFSLVFGHQYLPFIPSMFLLALTPFLLFQKTILAMGLQSLSLTRPIVNAALAGAIVQCTSSILVLPTFGLHAAGGPEAAGYCTSLFVLYRTWKSYTKKRPVLPIDAEPMSSRALEVRHRR